MDRLAIHRPPPAAIVCIHIDRETVTLSGRTLSVDAALPGDEYRSLELLCALQECFEKADPFEIFVQRED